MARILDVDYPGIRTFGTHKDGGIDLCWEDENHNRTVFQCKLLSGTTSSTKTVWQREDKKHLDRNLKLNREGRLVGEGQYGPWRDRKKPIVRYVLCHGGRSVNHLHGADELEQEDEDLRKYIERFFRTDIAQRRGFKHLEKISVELFSGDQLAKRCAAQSRLQFQLFGPALPPGIASVSDLNTTRTSTEKFQDYLHQLPYYSRAAFRAESVETCEEFPDEHEILNKLFDQERDDPVLIVTGPGGYGKTRLTFELCKLAQETHNCVAFRLDDDVPASDVVELLKTIPADVCLLLWVDYLETYAYFDQVVEVVTAYTRTSARAHIIANCRTSYFKTQIYDEFENVIDLAAERDSDIFERYRRRVFTHILRVADLRNVDEFGNACGYNPVLAAFLLYVARNSKTGGQLSDLKELVEQNRYRRDFASWLVSRLHRSVNNFTPTPSVAELIATVTPLLASLPTFDDRFSAIIAIPGIKKYVDVLIHDRLIERRVREGDNEGHERWVPVHDIIVDYLLGRLLTTATILSETVKEIFDFSERVSLVGNVIISLQRVFEAGPIKSFGWKDFIVGRALTGSNAWARAAPVVLRTNLLSDRDKVYFLERVPQMSTILLSRRELDRTFYSIAYRYSKLRKPEHGSKEGYDAQILVPYLQNSLAHGETAYGIACALRYNPTQFESQARQMLFEANLSIELCHLFSAWAESGLDCDIMQTRFVKWLEAGFCTALIAQFAFTAWLTVAHETPNKALVYLAAFESHLARWVSNSNNQRNIGAKFVFISWLKVAELARGDHLAFALRELGNPIGVWLGLYGQIEDARYVYSAWLSASAKAKTPDEVIDFLSSEHFEDWLKKHCDKPLPHINYVFCTWCNAISASGSNFAQRLKLLLPYVERWLGTAESTKIPAAYVYHDWLMVVSHLEDATEVRTLSEFVRKPILAWLTTADNELDVAASFIYSGWLNAAANVSKEYAAEVVDVLDRGVKKWLDHWKTSGACGFVTNALDLALIQAGRAPLSIESTTRYLIERIWNLERKLQPLDGCVSDDIESDLKYVADNFVLPSTCSNTLRDEIRKSILIPLRVLLDSEALKPYVSRIFAIGIRHEQVFDAKKSGGVRLRASHVRMAREAVECGAIVIEDLENRNALNQYLLYVLALEPFDPSYGDVLNELFLFYSKYPDCDCWTDVFFLRSDKLLS